VLYLQSLVSVVFIFNEKQYLFLETNLEVLLNQGFIPALIGAM